MNTKIFIGILTTVLLGFSLRAAPTETFEFPTAKKLISPEIKLLTTVFEDEPIGILHMEIAHNTGLQVMKELGSDPATPETIARNVKKMIKPIEEFFDKIKAFTSILKPLLEESLGQIQNNKILLLNCFDSSITSAAFFEQNIKSKEQLVGMCHEFIIFYRDIKASLTPKAKEKYIALKKRIIDERKAAIGA
jgi:hypothetical protein